MPATLYRAIRHITHSLKSDDGETAVVGISTEFAGEWQDIAVLICELPPRESDEVPKLTNNGFWEVITYTFSYSRDGGATWQVCNDPRHWDLVSA